MTSVSLIIWGAIGIGLLSILFLFHELRNAPYEEAPESAPAVSEVEKQRLRYLSWD